MTKTIIRYAFCSPKKGKTAQRTKIFCLPAIWKKKAKAILLT